MQNKQKIQYILSIFPNLISVPLLGTAKKHFNTFQYGIRNILCDSTAKPLYNTHSYTHTSYISYENNILKGTDQTNQSFISILRSLSIPLYSNIHLKIGTIQSLSDFTYLIEEAELFHV